MKYDVKGIRDIKNISHISRYIGGKAVVEEKIDGILVIITNRNGYWDIFSKAGLPIIKSRMGDSEKKEIMKEFNILKKRLPNGEELIIYAEYLPREKPDYLHTEYYDKYKGKFYLLDVYKGGRFLSLEEKSRYSIYIELPRPKVFEIYSSFGVNQLKNIILKLYKNRYFSEISINGQPEGVVIKNYDPSLKAFKIRLREDFEWIKRVLKR